MRAGLNSTDVVQIRNEMAKAPPAEHPDSVTVKAVKIPRVAVPGLEDSVEGTVDAEWLEPKEGGEGLPVLLYYHGGVGFGDGAGAFRVFWSRSHPDVLPTHIQIFIYRATASCLPSLTAE